MTFDSQAAEACITLLDSGCPSGNLIDYRCLESPFAGIVPDGDSCNRDVECAGDEYCDYGPVGQEVCPGTCATRTDLGGPCERDGECVRTANGHPQCSSGGVQRICIEVSFTAESAENGPCGPAGSTATSVTYTNCGPGLLCRGGTCMALPGDSMPCGSAEPCAEGFACIQGACAPVMVKNAVNDTCGDGTSFCNPYFRLQCVAGLCEELGDGTQDATCVSGDESPFTCNTGLTCDEVTTTCVPYRAGGQNCSADHECASGDCNGGVCREPSCVNDSYGGS